MTAWNRLETELTRQHKTQKSLQETLGVSKQAMGHWAVRGVPAKYIDDCAEFIGKAPFWLKNGGDENSPAITASNVHQVPVRLGMSATENVVTFEQITEALSIYLMQMDDDARDDAGDALRKLAHKPENHARTAAMLTTAFHAGKRKRA